MRRKSFDALVSAGGLMLTLVLVVAGALAFWGYSYSNNTVASQLKAQDIVFPTSAELAQAQNPAPGGFSEVTPAMVKYLKPYAGKLMTTGAQAEAYANHFILIHLQEMTGGKTYSQVSAEAMAAKPGTAQATALKALEQTVFQGTSLRGMLLNAYGWWKIGQIALISSIVSFVMAGLTLVLSAFGIRHYRRVPVDLEIPKVAAAKPILSPPTTAPLANV